MSVARTLDRVAVKGGYLLSRHARRAKPVRGHLPEHMHVVEHLRETRAGDRIDALKGVSDQHDSWLRRDITGPQIDSGRIHAPGDREIPDHLAQPGESPLENGCGV